MCKTTFLQMCSFSVILVSLHSLDLSFPLPFYDTSTAIHFLHSHPDTRPRF